MERFYYVFRAYWAMYVLHKQWSLILENSYLSKMCITKKCPELGAHTRMQYSTHQDTWPTFALYCQV